MMIVVWTFAYAAFSAAALFCGFELSAVVPPIPPGKLTAIITRAGDLPQKQGHVPSLGR